MRRLAIVVMIIAAASPALADGYVASARLGPAHVDDTDGDLDDPPKGWGMGAGVALGYAIGRFVPAVAVDAATLTGTANDAISGKYVFHRRLVALSAKLAVDVVDNLDVSVGLGYGADFENSDFTPKGYRLELGAGYRVWHDAQNGIRIEANLVQWVLTSPGEPYSHEIDQYGASVAYERRF